MLGSRWFIAGSGAMRPKPRASNTKPCAGHAGVVLGSRWYIAGGGDNSGGCSDLVALELQGLRRGVTLRWRHVVKLEPRSALVSEGLSLLALPKFGVLVSFGGYNGKYHNSVHLFKPGTRPKPYGNKSSTTLSSIPLLHTSPEPCTRPEPLGIEFPRT